MKKAIVCTTINPPTEAILRYDAMPDWVLIVIGDMKTPESYRLERGIYIPPSEQEKRFPKLSKAIGWNCIQRRNIGFLIARELGADVIATVDDDNIPFDDWGTDLVVGSAIKVDEYLVDAEAFDPIGATNFPHLWHRGFPLQLLPLRRYDQVVESYVTPSVQASFWNGDPDVDAICRLEYRPDCVFTETCFPMAANQPGPFNSQNTIFDAALLPDYFLFPHVGRMDDIWASYYVQALGHRVVYTKPSVFQMRNEHDLIVDMRNEYLGYENNLDLLTCLAVDPNAIRRFLPQRTQEAWEAYREAFS